MSARCLSISKIYICSNVIYWRGSIAIRGKEDEHSLALTVLRHLVCADFIKDIKECPKLSALYVWNCRDKALELLKRGWPPGDEPRYDPDHVLVLCRMAGFQPGLLHLYEHLRLFREVLRVRALLTMIFT